MKLKLVFTCLLGCLSFAKITGQNLPVAGGLAAGSSDTVKLQKLGSREEIIEKIVFPIVMIFVNFGSMAFAVWYTFKDDKKLPKNTIADAGTFLKESGIL